MFGRSIILRPSSSSFLQVKPWVVEALQLICLSFGSALHKETQTINCYAACEILPLEADGIDSLVGGLFGYKSRTPATIACFWDTELSGVTTSTGSSQKELGTGLSTEQMQDEMTFRNAGWDFNYVWMISEGEYPKLRWEAIED